ncbi:IS3 family transposase [Allosalinactinospora lopnorensis]|uniref:IS3 family transposase n=1 Tax=Allosalinactinospora lopnorensis TaxID=1352348 RepID=UPI00373FCB04
MSASGCLAHEPVLGLPVARGDESAYRATARGVEGGHLDEVAAPVEQLVFQQGARASPRFSADRPVQSGFLPDACARFATRAEAEQEVFSYIEGFYNPWRRHSANGQLSPAEYERRHTEKTRQGAAVLPEAA